MTTAISMASRKQRLAAGLTLALGLACLPAAQATPWDDAQSAFAEFDDRQGLRLLAQAAQAGDARAMHAWALALRHGPRLFPGILRADAAQAAVWFDRVARHCLLQRVQVDVAAPDAAPCSGLPSPRNTGLAPEAASTSSSGLGTRRP